MAPIHNASLKIAHVQRFEQVFAAHTPDARAPQGLTAENYHDAW